jgi:hypothetical protein
MSSLEEVAEESFPPNGLLGCLCTVSWWLQPTSSKTKVYVSKTPSQLTLIGIAVGPELWKQAWVGRVGHTDGVCGTKGRTSQILLVGTYILIFFLWPMYAVYIIFSIVSWLGKNLWSILSLSIMTLEDNLTLYSVGTWNINTHKNLH